MVTVTGWRVVPTYPPKRGPFQEGNLIFQPLCFRGRSLVFGGVYIYIDFGSVRAVDGRNPAPEMYKIL